MLNLVGGLLLLAGSLGSSGCEALVGDSLPSPVPCSGDLASTCPAGQSCINSLCAPTPIPGHDAGRDVFVFDAHVVLDAGHDTTKPPADVGVDAPPTMLALGDSCGGDPTACAAPLFCLDTTDLVGLTFPEGGSLCSATCCSDSDCSGDNVCYGTTGGNYCLTAATATARCPSGGCGTACCSSTSSGGCSGTCGLDTTPTGGSSPECSASGGLHKVGDDCEEDSACASGFCAESLLCSDFGSCCQEAVDCCSSKDCGENGTCNWFEGTDLSNATLIFRSCGGTGTAATGQSCVNNPDSNDCAGGICTAFVGSNTVCTEPCCTDRDCSDTSGWVCRPFNVPLSAGSIELLVCQPPPMTVN